MNPPRPTQLEGWFLSSKTILPRRADVLTRPPLPTATHQGGVDINEQGAVFHPLNGSGAKGTTGRSNASRRKQKERILPKGYPSRIGALCGCTVARNHLHWSTFSFSESRTAVFFSLKRKSGFGPSRAGKKSKRKAVEASAWQAATSKTEKGSLSAEGKSRFVKFLCRADKISAPAKVRWLAEKRLPARGTPHP